METLTFVLMIIEVLCRYAKTENDEVFNRIDDELDTQELISKYPFNKEKERQKLIAKYKAFEYGPLILNLNDIATFNQVDATHTHICLYTGAAYSIKINYEHFKQVYQTLLCKVINDFKTLEEFKPNMNGKQQS